MAHQQETLSEWKLRTRFRSKQTQKDGIFNLRLDIESITNDLADLNDDLAFAWVDGEIIEEEMMEQRLNLINRLAILESQLEQMRSE